MIDYKLNPDVIFNKEDIERYIFMRKVFKKYKISPEMYYLIEGYYDNKKDALYINAMTFNFHRFMSGIALLRYDT